MIDLLGAVADETLSTAWAFILFCIVFALGRVWERRRKPKPVYKRPPNLHCGCGDELSFHEGLGRCTKMDTKWVAKDPANGENLYVDRPCGCVQYTGDLPEDWWSRVGLMDTPELPAPDRKGEAA